MLITVLGCSYSFGDPTKKAIPAAEEFNKMYNAKQFAEIYDKSDDSMKKALTRAQFIEAMFDSYDKLGKIKNAKNTDSQNIGEGTTTAIKLFSR